MKITVETTVDAPIANVWGAYNSADDVLQWNAAFDDWHTTSAAVNLRVGGDFSYRMEAKDGSMGFDFEGTYTKIVEPELIDYSFGDREARVEFKEKGDSAIVRVTFDAESTNSEDQQREGWQTILNNFKQHVESAIQNASMVGPNA